MNLLRHPELVSRSQRNHPSLCQCRSLGKVPSLRAKRGNLGKSLHVPLLCFSSPEGRNPSLQEGSPSPDKGRDGVGLASLSILFIPPHLSTQSKQQRHFPYKSKKKSLHSQKRFYLDFFSMRKFKKI